ncbi:MAG: RidA family protein [Hyphomicrobiaceae bacterium]|nr:RidA family protein [Hyphomicrobiaceae bacterium]
MKKRPITAPDGNQPVSRYAEAMEVVDARRWLFLSGQTPMRPDGSIPEDFRDQGRQVWANIQAQLRAAEMTLDNIVKVTVFLSDRRYGPIHRAIREEILGDRVLGLTVIIVGALDERWLLEVEVIAAA